MFLRFQPILALFLMVILPADHIAAQSAPAQTRPNARVEEPTAPTAPAPTAPARIRPKARGDVQADTQATAEAAPPAQDTNEVDPSVPRSTSSKGVVFATDAVVPPRPLSLAIAAAERGEWEQASSLARREDPAAQALITYIKLETGQGTASEVLEFMDQHPDWPDLDKMRIKAEISIQDMGPEAVLAFFRDRPAESGLGALSYARAAEATGQADKMRAILIEAWRTLDLTTEEHDAFLKDYEAIVAPYHAERLDMALWRGLQDVALMLPLVDEATRVRAEKRLALDNKTQPFDDIIPTLSASDKTNPGIAYALFEHAIDTDQKDEAIEILLRQSTRKNGLGVPEKWSGWRRAFAREEMRDGNAKIAYKLAATHQLTEGGNYADLEWLSGYLALTYLDAPAVAYLHFENLKNAVKTPISLGRAYYWMGRALEASDQPEAAQAAYAEGGQYQSSFYGLLAAEKAGMPFDLWPATGPAPSSAQEFESEDLFRAAAMAYDIDQDALGYALMMALADSLPEPQLHRLAQIITEQYSPFLGIKFGKRAAQRGIILPEAYYTMHPLADMNLPVPTELALSIARRESEFNSTVRSHAGAEGLMQLMPGTARDVARDLGEDHSRAKVLNDWSYNVRLGSAYLAQLARRFDGNITMISAGYNAGPGRPVQWMENFGDPRKSNGPDIVDWIEHIPFRETRNYVMRVSESLPIYRARLGKTALPVPFSQELAGASISLAKMSSKSIQ